MVFNSAHFLNIELIMDSTNWIKLLGLEKHPEGGYFREVYRSDEGVVKSHLPERFQSKHAFSSAIYYLLSDREKSHFHRIQQDEIWHFYDGAPMIIYTIDAHRMTAFRLGKNPDKGQLPMLVVPKGTIFAAEVENQRSFSLVGCTVSPGFEYEDFELMTRESLVQMYPEHHEIIGKFTRL